MIYFHFSIHINRLTLLFVLSGHCEGDRNIYSVSEKRRNAIYTERYSVILHIIKAFVTRGVYLDSE